jgi:hypothetical protein
MQYIAGLLFDWSNRLPIKIPHHFKGGGSNTPRLEGASLQRQSNFA